MESNFFVKKVIFASFIFGGCTISADKNSIQDAYIEHSNKAFELQISVRDVFYPFVVENSHLLIEEHFTKKLSFISGTPEFDRMDARFVDLLGEVIEEDCTRSNYLISYSLRDQSKDILWQAFYSVSSSQLLYKGNCFNVVDSDAFIKLQSP